MLLAVLTSTPRPAADQAWKPPAMTYTLKTPAERTARAMSRVVSLSWVMTIKVEGDSGFVGGPWWWFGGH